MNEFRPEYIAAIDTAKWNVWLIPLFLFSPTLIAFCFYKRFDYLGKAAGAGVSILISWILFAIWMAYIA